MALNFFGRRPLSGAKAIPISVSFTATGGENVLTGGYAGQTLSGPLVGVVEAGDIDAMAVHPDHVSIISIAGFSAGTKLVSVYQG
jgi:hypothetical protein